MRNPSIISTLAIALTVFFTPALAADFPSKPINLLVGYPPGGAVDVVGRILAQHLAPALGQAVVVENRGGASGNIAAAYVSKSQPDGHTLLVAPITGYAMNTALDAESMSYSLEQDFAAVSLVGYLPLVLLVNKASPANDVPGLQQVAREKSEGLTYGSSGNGQVDHVAGELFRQQAGIKLLHVPYRGAAPAVLDLASGQIDLLFATTPTAMTNLKGGKLKPLMITAPHRLPMLADVPTAQELGYKGFEIGTTYGILAPADTPMAIRKRLNTEIMKVLALPDVKDRLLGLGVQILTSTPDQAQEGVKSELDRWENVFVDLNISAN